MTTITLDRDHMLAMRSLVESIPDGTRVRAQAWLDDGGTRREYEIVGEVFTARWGVGEEKHVNREVGTLVLTTVVEATGEHRPGSGVFIQAIEVLS